MVAIALSCCLDYPFLLPGRKLPEYLRSYLFTILLSSHHPYG